MRKEADVWQRFRECLPRGVMARRIEDASGALGTWDCWLGSGRWGMWLEFKFTATDKRKPELRPGQMAFGYDLKAAKVEGRYVVGCGQGNVRILDQLYDGEDWKKSQQEQWLSINEKNVLGLLKDCGLEL